MCDCLHITYEHNDLVSQVTLMKHLIILNSFEGHNATQFLDDWQSLLGEAAISGLIIPINL